MKLIIAMVILFIGLFVWSIASVDAQSNCPTNSIIQVQDGFALNVRKEAGGASEILKTLKHQDGEQRVVELKTVNKSDFLRLESGGWIINKYLEIIRCVETPTPTRTITLVPTITNTPTRTPMPEITPTRISGTPEPGAWYCDRYGCVYLTYPVTIRGDRP